MKIKEVANAEEQVALLKLIMDKTWEALAVQARQQSQEKAAKDKRPKPALKSVKAPLQPSAVTMQKQPAMKSLAPSISAKPQSRQIRPDNAAVQISKPVMATKTKNMGLPQVVATSQNRSIDSKNGFVDEKDNKDKKDLYGNDGHSKNGWSF